MLATTTNIGEMGSVAGFVINDFLPLIYIILGLVIGFWVLGFIIKVLHKKNLQENPEEDEYWDKISEEEMENAEYEYQHRFDEEEEEED